MLEEGCLGTRDLYKANVEAIFRNLWFIVSNKNTLGQMGVVQFDKD